MKKEKYEHCSRRHVERYLLNKMSADEETFFQEHLEECDDCRAYLNTVRTLSEALGCDDVRRHAPSAAEGSPVRMFRLGRAMMVAAGILILAGVFFYRLNSSDEDGVTSHNTYIDDLPSKSDIMNFAAELVFPDSDTLLFNIDNSPLMFKWDREVPFRLELLSDGKTIVETEGFGDNCMPDFKAISGCDSLDWILNADGEEWKGHIIFTK